MFVGFFICLLSRVCLFVLGFLEGVFVFLFCSRVFLVFPRLFLA